MKKLTLMAAIAAMTIATVNAQDWSGSVYQFGKVYPGYIVKLSGDTVNGFVQHQNRSKNQTECNFYTDPNDKKSKVTYKSDDIKAYKVGDKDYRAIRYSGGLIGKAVRFNLLVADGHIARYMWYYKEQDINMQSGNESDYDFDKRIHTEKQVYIKGDAQPFDHDKFALRWGKVMSELVSENAELATKVSNKDKGYGLLNHYDIISEYNTWYAQNKK
jgi:hypothetical protein